MPVNFADADVTFKSSDGVLFHVHRKNLEVCSEGFPPAEIPITQGEIVSLEEAAVTLEVLFQFMYPQRHPALDTTSFEVLEPLAEAAEKYQVFPAMNICHIRLKEMVHEHPVEVAVYAAKHDYPYLLSEVAPMMISMDPVQVVEMLPSHLVLPWVWLFRRFNAGLTKATVQIRYVQEWTSVHRNCALVFPPEFTGVVGHIKPRDPYRDYATGDAYSYCSWGQRLVTCLQRLSAGVHALRSLDEVFAMATDGVEIDYCCRRELATWRRQIEEGIAKIPKFNTFL
ncbi:hypothetical protein B0H19DRAFT_961760 [Mycena capillaripes]|nr:hypothetical protein B0H19DRAFT_961760 [Mycena capillaripes]